MEQAFISNGILSNDFLQADSLETLLETNSMSSLFDLSALQEPTEAENIASEALLNKFSTKNLNENRINENRTDENNSYKLYFPDKKTMPASNAVEFVFNDEELTMYRQANEDLYERGCTLALNYSKLPSSVSASEIISLIKDTYGHAINMFDEKIKRGVPLLREEKAIYDLCKREVTANSSKLTNLSNSVSDPNSVWGLLFSSIEKIRDCIDEIRDWFALSTAEDKANLKLVDQGHEILPDYGNLIKGFFTDIKGFFVEIFTPTVLGIADAQLACATRFQRNTIADKNLASKMLDIAGYGYDGYSTISSTDFSKLNKNELPESLRVIYDETKGLLKGTRGLQAWLGKKGNDIVVSFSGTDTSNRDMIYADIVQLSSPSVLYLKAAGLLRMIISKFPNKTIYVTGHSLGGGLTQFALTANMDPLSQWYLKGFGYNPAGLSAISLWHLKDSRLLKAKSCLWIYMTSYDVVSTFGGKVGTLTTLPKTDENGHSRDALKKCMKKYLKESYHVSGTDIAVSLRIHNETDFIPYTYKVSCIDENRTVYPIFNNNVSSSIQTTFATAKISSVLFNELKLSKSLTDNCLGVYSKFNGTAHTVLNRLLLMTKGSPTISTSLQGNVQSTIIYGKYGLGIKYFIPILRDSFVNSSEMYTDARGGFEKIIANLNNPFEYDKDAWVKGFKTVDIDLIQIFTRYPRAMEYFDQWLINLTSDRIDLYQSIYKEASPTAADKKKFMTEMADLVKNRVNTMLKEAVNNRVIKNTQKTYCETFIDSYCANILKTF